MGAVRSAIDSSLYVFLTLGYNLGAYFFRTLPDLYYQLFPNEPLRIKLLVYIIFILETIQTILLTNAVWRWLVSGFGEVERLNLVGTDLWISVCVVGGLGRSFDLSFEAIID